jgi:hypothetical protein
MQLNQCIRIRRSAEYRHWVSVWVRTVGTVGHFERLDSSEVAHIGPQLRDSLVPRDPGDSVRQPVEQWREVLPGMVPHGDRTEGCASAVSVQVRKRHTDL